MTVPELFPEPVVDADRAVVDAIVEHEPRKTFCLFSGGDDSTVLLSWARRSFGHKIDAAVWVDTGTSIEPDPDDPSDTTPSVRAFVESFCDNRGVPLIILEAGDAYRRMCLEHGMPGPGAHPFAYIRLKERQFEKLTRQHKEQRGDRLLLLSGVRRAESRERKRKADVTSRKGARVWVNPLIDWTNDDMRAYREEHALERNPVALLLHRSGECNCGARATKGEREMLRGLFPRWFERVIAPLERDCAERGLPCVWGERWARPVKGEVGPGCSECALSLWESEEAA